MIYLYLDESGDLGFDFVNKKPSKFFTITILVIEGKENNRSLINAVKKTIKRKLNPKNKRKRIVPELKATSTTGEIKRYFYQQVKNIPFNLYSITLNKRKVFDRLADNKSRVYNFIARQVLDNVPFEKNKTSCIDFVIDRSKTKLEIADFNQYIKKQLEGRIDPKISLNIMHENSQNHMGIQAADLFTYGIFQKYERNNFDWYLTFKKKIMFDKQYL